MKMIQQTDDSNTASLLRTRLENEKNILLKLQSKSGGSQYYVKCLVNRLEWNESNGNEDQDLYWSHLRLVGSRMMRTQNQEFLVWSWNQVE